MRITGGILAGRLVKVPPGIIRPAMDRMRESVFAALGNLEGLSFLDLFSGSGVIALEAASRGAAFIEAVETDNLKRKILLENVQISPVRIHCRFMPVELYVKRAPLPRSEGPFDFIFCDPPFPYRHKQELLRAIASSPLLGESSTLLLHRPGKEALGDIPSLALRETRNYGRSAVDFFSKTVP